jgi:hypothetical protein
MNLQPSLSTLLGRHVLLRTLTLGSQFPPPNIYLDPLNVHEVTFLRLHNDAIDGGNDRLSFNNSLVRLLRDGPWYWMAFDLLSNL